MQRRCLDKSRQFYRAILHNGIYPVWVAGLTLGFAADRFYGDVYYGLLEQAPLCQPDLWGLALVNVFPLLISALAVLIFPALLYFLCLIRGISLGAGLAACAGIYGQAGPMMALLLLFSLVLFSPVMLWYWTRALCADHAERLADTLLCCAAALVLLGVDLWITAPFLGEIMIF